METNKPPAHNFWHALACAESPLGDQTNNGISIQCLKKGDIVKFETLRGGDGFAARVTLEVTHPKQGGVKVVQVVRFLGELVFEVKKESLGRGVAGFFAVRGDKRDGKVPELGWIGVGADIHLTGGVVFRSVKNISLNNTMIVFPPSDTVCH